MPVVPVMTAVVTSVPMTAMPVMMPMFFYDYRPRLYIDRMGTDIYRVRLYVHRRGMCINGLRVNIDGLRMSIDGGWLDIAARHTDNDVYIDSCKRGCCDEQQRHYRN